MALKGRKNFLNPPTHQYVNPYFVGHLELKTKKNMRGNQEIIMQQQDMQQPTFKTGWNSWNLIASNSISLVEECFGPTNPPVQDPLI